MINISTKKKTEKKSTWNKSWKGEVSALQATREKVKG